MLIVFSAFILLFTNNSFSQTRADNWVFNRFGIKFTLDSAIIQDYYVGDYARSMGSMSDNEGNLLFYSDGVNVFNKQKQLMANGSNICIYDSMWFHRCIIIPKPASDSLYYIFSLAPGTSSDHSGLSYSIVDMSLRGGLGEVILKGMYIQDSLSNMFTALYHENKKDIWLITSVVETNRYNSLLITENGISDSVVVNYGIRDNLSGYGGMLSAAPDGSMVVAAYNNWTAFNREGFELFEFNSLTGELLNPLCFDVPQRYVRSAEFSSDGTKLYVFQAGSIGEATLFQYDVSEYSFDKIETSREVVLNPMHNGLREMQLGPDGKIYIAKGGGAASGAKYLGVINYPNRKGAECKIEELGFWLGGSGSERFTPNVIQSYLFGTDIAVENLCLGDSTNLRVTNLFQLDSVLWDFDDNHLSREFETKHYYSESGIYNVMLTAYYPEKTDTIIRQITISALPVFSLGNDTNICVNQVITLQPDTLYTDCSYLWNQTVSETTIDVDTSGTHILQLTNPEGCIYSDDITIGILELPQVNLGNDTTIDQFTNLVLDAGFFGNPTSYLWDDYSDEQFRTIDGGKINIGENHYYVQVTDEYGCTGYDTIIIVKINETEPDVPESEWCKFYPNPTNYGLTIVTNDDSQKTIRLYNGMGQIIRENSFESDTYTMDISELADAVYFVRIYEDSRLVCRNKILVRKIF